MLIKSQAGIDYFIVIAILLVLLSPFWIYLYDNLNRSEDDLKIAYAKTASARIREAADLVYSQGAPAQLTMQLYFPKGINAANVTSDRIIFRVRVAGGMTDVVSTAKAAQMNGTLPTSDGYHLVTVKAMDGYVNVTGQ